MKRGRQILLGIFIFTFLMACSNTTLVTSWESPQMDKTEQINSFSIVAVLGKNLDTNVFVQGVLEEMNKAEIEAVNGEGLFTPSKKYDKESFENDMKKSNTDAIMFFKLLSLKKSRTYSPPTTYVYPSGPFIGGPYRGYYFPQPYAFYYWYPAWQVVNSPGYWSESSDYQLEVAVYSAEKDQLIYTARTDTFDPHGSMDLATSSVRKIIKDMQHKGLIKKPSKKKK